MNRKRLERFLEFLIIGVAMGTVEDVIAVGLATNQPITFEVVAIIFIVAVPFAAFSELVIDHEEVQFPEKIARKLGKSQEPV
ncbi:MAG: hypothetical protein ABEJ93_00555 [Candidatus Nanohalobium sp.]